MSKNTFTSVLLLSIDTSHHNGPPLTLTMTTILLQHPNQCWRLPLLSWKPHGFACVKRKEGDNLPAEWAKNKSHEAFHDQINNHNSSSSKVPALFRIHSFPALACNYTPGITLILSKLVSTSLASNNHDEDGSASNKQHNHVRRQQYQQHEHVRRNAGHVSISNNWWLHIYLSCVCFDSIYWYSYSLTHSACLFLSTVLYHQQQC